MTYISDIEDGEVIFWRELNGKLVEIEIEYHDEDVSIMDVLATAAGDDIFGEGNWVFKDGLSVEQDYQEYSSSGMIKHLPIGSPIGRVILARI